MGDDWTIGQKQALEDLRNIEVASGGKLVIEKVNLELACRFIGHLKVDPILWTAGRRS